MERNGWLWPFYQAFRDGYDQDPTGEQAVHAVTGSTLSELDDPFRRWLRAL